MRGDVAEATPHKPFFEHSARSESIAARDRKLLLGARAALALHLDPVVVRESLAHDPLQILQPPGGARALLRFETGPAQAHRLPPEQVHGPSPARVKQGSREVQSVGHGPLF